MGAVVAAISIESLIKLLILGPHARLTKTAHQRVNAQSSRTLLSKDIFAPDESNPRPAYTVPLRSNPTHTTYEPPHQHRAALAHGNPRTGSTGGREHHEERQGLLSAPPHGFHDPWQDQRNIVAPIPTHAHGHALQPQRAAPAGPRSVMTGGYQDMNPRPVRTHGNVNSGQQGPGWARFAP